MNDENLQNLNKLLAVMSKDHLGTKDFTKHFKQVIDFVKKIEAKNLKEFELIKQTITSLTKKLEGDNAGTSDKLNKTITAELESLLRRFSSKSKELDIKMGEIKNGDDADEEIIVGKVLDKIVMPEYKETVLDDATQLRDKLESLKGEDELKLSTIDSLKKEMEDLKQNVQTIGQRRLVGGTPHNMTHVKDLTSQCDGTKKIFYVDGYKKPLLLLCPDFPTIYRPNVDYTLANKTLTLTSEVDAPQDGQTLLFMYVK